jgi:hypothetical protein
MQTNPRRALASVLDFNLKPQEIDGKPASEWPVTEPHMAAL